MYAQDRVALRKTDFAVEKRFWHRNFEFEVSSRA
jgi:hypothetical protein